MSENKRAAHKGRGGIVSGRLLCTTSLSALMLLALPSVARAQDANRNWDANGTAVGNGGTGTWDTTNSTWSPNSDGVSGPYGPWNNVTLDNPIFGGTAGTVTLGVPITVHNMTFSTSGYTLTGNTLTLAGTTPTITVTGSTATINSIIAGTAGVTKAGGGTLTLSANNSFTGGVTVNAGTLTLDGSNSFTGSVNVNAATLNLNGSNSFTGTINVNGTLFAATNASLGNSANVINLATGSTLRSTGLLTGRVVNLTSGQSSVFSGAAAAHFTGVGGISAASCGSCGVFIELSDNTNDFTGQVTLGSNNSTGVSFRSVRNTGQASALGAGGAISLVGNTSTSAFTYTGSGDSSNRDWQMTTSGGSPTLVFRNGGSGTLTLTGNISATGSINSYFQASSGDLQLLGVLSGASGTFRFAGSGTNAMTLGTANTFTAPASVEGGLVKVGKLADGGASSSLGAGTSIAVSSSGTLSYVGGAVSSNRTLSFTNGTLSNDGSGALTLSGAATLAGSLTLAGSFTAANNILSGVFSGTGALNSSGPATWVLSGANTRTGAITVNGGTLRGTNAASFGTVNGITVTGGTLDTGGFDLATPTLAGTGGIIALGAGTLSVNATSAQVFGGSISGTGGLTKLGSGLLTLTGQSTYSGATTITNGPLRLDFSAAGAPASNIIAAASTLNMSSGSLSLTGKASTANSQTFGGLTITGGNNTISAASGTGGSMTVNFGAINRTNGLVNFVLPASGSFTTSNLSLGPWATVNGSDYATVAGGNIVAFAGYVNKDNPATWVNGDIVSDESLPANSAYNGTLAGDVALGGIKYTAASNSVVNLGGHTLSTDGSIIVAPTVGNFSQTITNGNLTGGAGGGTLGVQQNSTGTGSFTIAATIVDNGGATGFAKAGAGLVTLSGTNSYTGATTVSQGTLSVNTIANGGVASAIGASTNAASNLVIQGATLQYTGGNATSDRGFTIETNGPIAGSTISVTNAGSNLTFSGLVTSPDGAGLTKTGAGTLTLAGAVNDYTGVTTVSGGTLAVSTLANGGLVSSIGASSSVSSNLILQSGGELEYTGGTIGIDRGFTLGTGGGAIDVANAATVLTISGTVLGTAGQTLSKNGAGTLILSGANSGFTAGGFVNAGTLRAGSTQALGTGGWTIASGATLDLGNNAITTSGIAGGGTVNLGSARLTIGGSSLTFSGTVTGTGGVTLNGGTQAFTGCGNDYTGSTILQGSNVLIVDCLANGNTASGIGASGSASTNLVFNVGGLRYTGGTVTTNRGFQLLSTGSIDVQNAGTTLTFTGVATGAGLLRKDGAGTLVLSGANTLTGSTGITGGVLRAGSATALGPGSVALSDVAGAALDMNNFSSTFLFLAGGGANGGNILLGSGSVTLNYAAGTTQTYGGAISGTGGFIKGGAASFAQVLSSCNSSYTGATTINSGTLEVSCLADGGLNSSIGGSGSAASNLILSGGTLRYTGTGGSTNRLFTLGASANSKIEANGTGALSFTNTGAVVFSSPNTAQTIRLGGTNTGNNSFALQITDNNTGATSFTKEDAGTWILANSGSTYTGVTTISGGVLGVDKLADGTFASSIGRSSNVASNLVIGTGSTLRYTGAGDSTDRLFTLQTGVSFIESSGTGAIAFTNNGTMGFQGNAARVLALGGTNTGANRMGVKITDGTGGATTLAKNDAGTWYLTGANTYTGPTNVNAGILYIGNGGTTGSIQSTTANIASGSTLGFNRSDAVSYAGTIAGAGAVQQLGTGTTTLTGNSTYTGGTTISAGTLQLGGGGSTGSIVGNVTNNGTLTFNRNDAYTFGGTISGSGQVAQIGSGTTILTGTNSYGGGTSITAGTLQVSSDANLGAASGGLTFNGGTLRTTASMTAARAVTLTGAGTFLTDPSTTLTLNSAVAGAGTLTKTGTGTLVLTANNSYTGGTTISAGTLQIGNGGATGNITGNVLNNGALVANRSGTLTLGGVISGGGSFTQSGSGTTILTASNSYAGATNVNAGTLLVNGNQSGATGLTSVASGATLGGNGTIGGSVNIADGGTLAAGSNGVGALTVNGDLALGSTSQLAFELGQANVPGGPLNDLVNIGGNLTLDGTINVTQPAGGTFGPGVYRMFNYAGTLTDNGLTIGTLPSGTAFVQTALAKQVNLVNTAGMTLSFWDGAAGPKNDGSIQGGDGTWRVAGGENNWTEVNGAVNADYAQDSFAIFQGIGGTVTVDNLGGNVQASGLQFTSNGYVIAGGPLTLTGAQALVRTGDGSPTDDGITTTISAALAGSAQLVKDLGGTLVLSGTNTYTGGTAINGGTLQISSAANLGGGSAGLTFNGGTLRNTAAMAYMWNVTLGATGGTFQTDANLTLASGISGPGGLVKAGAGTLILNSNANTYTGGTTILEGTLQVSANPFNIGALPGDVVNHARLAFNLSGTKTFGGTVSGSGVVDQIGSGRIIFTGDSTYTGGTTISAGILQLGNGGTTGGITGDVANNAALVFNRSDEVTFAGLISGSGRVEQAGSGTTILTGANSYASTTTVSSGTLLVNGNQSAATGATSVASGATLGGIGIIGGDVTLAGGAILAPGDATGPGTLTINGNLALAGTSRLDYEFGQSNVVGGPLNDLTQVGGDLTLDGSIDVTVTPGGSFGPGLYRVISYGGTLNDQGLALGTLPPGTLVSVQTSVAGQVNLINATGATLNFWDGAALPNKGNGAVNGGDGTWQNSSGNDNWTETSGAVNGAYTDASFAIFAAAAGTVSVDNSLGAVSASGLQFATDGYTITGQDLTLVGPQSTVRVGDGSSVGLGFTATIDAALVGNSQLVKADLGTLVLTGANSYTGGTRIDAGTLRISTDANLGAAAGGLSFDGGTLHVTADISSDRNVDMISNGSIVADAGASLVFTGALTGAGNLIKDGAGILALNDTSNHSGTTDVRAGSLFINGDQSAALGLTSVATAATLGGSGIIGGHVVVADGATLAPGNSPGTLTINGDLALSGGSLLAFEFGQANVAGGALNDLVNVGGDLTLDGTIDVSVPTGGSFGPGVYRVFNYGGALTDNGLTLGTLPGGSAVSVQTAIAGQVNLVNTAGLTLNFWDGNAGPKNNSAIDGGNGVWRVGGGANNWTDVAGAVNADYAQNSFAIFSGASGTLSIDGVGGAVTASGLQFASNGYAITGDALTLTGAQAIVQVGDGSAASAGYTAAIDAELTGLATLVKTDAGTLVLTGTNSYSGGTVVSGGALRISSDSNLGDAAGNLSLGGGTLNTAADLSSARAITLVGAGTLLTDPGTTLTLTGTTSGTGSLTKSGAGTLMLGGTGSHTGATNVTEGLLLVNGNYSAGTGATNVASGASLGGTGSIGGNVILADGATLTPGAGGAGTLTIGGNLSLAAGTQLAYEFGQAGTPGGTLNDLVNVGGDLVLDGTINVKVSTGGAFDVGVYRVFNYGGVLTDNGLAVGTLPGGASASVQTSITGQVNLVNTGGLTLGFWDGAAGPKNNGSVNGGTGVWQNGTGNDNWTDSNGIVNAAYSDGAFAVFGGNGGTVTVDDSLGQVTAAGMQFAANGYTIAGNGITLTSPQSTIRVGDGSTGGAGFTATINAGLSGDTQLVKTDAGTLVLGGTNSYTGGTLINGGTVQISTDANLGAAPGAITLDGGTLATSANVTSARDIVMAGAGTISSASGTTFAFNGLLSGTGALTQTGAGTLLMTGNNAAFAGSTRVEGTMIVNGSLCGNVNVATGGRLGGTGTICTTVNAGTIAPGNSIGTLTVAGTYTGNNGTLEIEAQLGGDSSPTDRLVITGATSGTTQVNVINTGGFGAATVEGIKIVDIGGASDGVFTLNGDYVFEGDQAVIAGAYGYRLYKNGVATPTDGDWYLRSSLLNPTAPNEPQAPLYQPGVPLYESYAATLQTLNHLGTLQERVGNRQWSGFTQGGVGMWGRIESSRYRPEAVVSTSGSDLDVNDWSLQAGFDKALLDTNAGTLMAGINGRYGKADAQVRSRFGNGKIDTKGYGVGATVTWYDSTGFYADAQAQVSWYRSDLKSGVLGMLADNNHGSGEAFSLEVGKRAPLGGGLSVTPQIQMAYSNVRFDAFADPNGAAVSSDRADSLKSRWGISLDHQQVWDGTSGARQSHLYGIVNLTYEWLDGAATDVSGTSIERRDNRLWSEVGVGGSYSWSGGRYTLFTEVSANTAINNFGDSNSLKGNAGFRIKF